MRPRIQVMVTRKRLQGHSQMEKGKILPFKLKRSRGLVIKEKKACNLSLKSDEEKCRTLQKLRTLIHTDMGVRIVHCYITNGVEEIP